MRKATAVFLLVALAACGPDSPERSAGPETSGTEAEAWAQVYDRFLEESADGRVFDEIMGLRFPEVSQSELLRTWNPEERRSYVRHHRREALAVERLAARIGSEIDGREAPDPALLEESLARWQWVEWGPPYYQEKR